MALTLHFREWYGAKLTEANQIRNSIVGTDVELKRLKLEYELKKFELDLTMKSYATALMLKTRKPCKNCDGKVYWTVEDDWMHEDGDSTCQHPDGGEYAEEVGQTAQGA
jgi:hypothetical protein